MSYRCCDCESEFSELKIYTERHGLDSPPYETWEGCPNCGSTDWEESSYCNNCYEDKFEMSDEQDDFCEDCKDALMDKLNNWLDILPVNEKDFLINNGFVSL